MAQKLPKPSKNAQVINRWKYNIEAYANECMRFPQRGWKLTSQQLEGVREVEKLLIAKLKLRSGTPMTDEEKEYSRKIGISIMSGKGPGKDFECALLIFWFLTCFPSPRIVCTANTRNQLRDVLWSQLTNMLRGIADKPETIPIINQPGQEMFEIQADKVFLRELKGKEHFALGRTVNIHASGEEQAVAMMGHHADFMMFIVDEASGISYKLFETIESTLTQPCNFIIMVGNPTRRTGYFVDSHFKRGIKEKWIQLRWNTEESENVSEGFVEGWANSYGRDSDTYRINVLGLPPISDQGSFIPWDWAMDAVDREVPQDNDDKPVILGVDVARYGKDKTVILARQGTKILEPILRYNGLDGNEVASKIRYATSLFVADYVFIDTVGVGAAVWDNIKYDEDVRYEDFMASWSADDKNKFVRLGDECGWRVRERFQNKTISIPGDEELIAEATSREYETRDNGRIKLESKKSMKRRGLDSPNTFDALSMTFRYPDSYYLPGEEDDSDYPYYQTPKALGANMVTGY
jgi:hypothetical protein